MSDVTPTTPPPPATPPAAPAAVTPPKKNMNKIIIPIVAAVGVLLLVVVGLVVAPMLLGGKSSTTSSVPLIADLKTEPDTSWSYDFASSKDDYVYSWPSIVPVGDDMALVWAGFDSYSWEWDQEGSTGWYEGYDEDYAAGYDAGSAYLAAYDAWLSSDDWSLEYPSQADYYPSSGDPDIGWWDGFLDAYDGLSKGSNAAVAPKDPDYKGEVTMLDMKTGDDLWAVEVVDLVDNFDFSSDIRAKSIEDTNYSIIIAAEADSNDATIIALDNKTGEVASQETFKDFGSVAVADGAVFVVADVTADQKAWVGRFAPDALDGKAVWEADVDASSYAHMVGDYLVVDGGDEGYAFDPANGDEQKWAKDIDYDVNFSYIDGNLVRIERTDDGYEIEGVDADGKSTWDKRIDAEWMTFDEDTLFIAETTNDGIDRLERINPKNGESMWESAYREELYDTGYVDHFGDVALVVLVDRDKIALLNLATGEELFTDRLADDTRGIWPGESFYYVSAGGKLQAYETKTGDDVWSYRYDEDNEIIMQAGPRLLVLDTDKKSISPLAVD